MVFPDTRPSLISELVASEPERRARALRLVTEAYWKPVYLFVRRRFHLPPADTDDVVQEFFTQVLESQRFASFDPERGRFRTYLLRSLTNFTIDRHRASTARKRAAQTVELSEAEELLAAAPDDDPEAAFERDWVRQVMSLSVERLTRRLTERGKLRHLEVFRRFHLVESPPSYDEVATELAIKVTDVTNSLHAARRELRSVALDLLRELTASEEEFRWEARAVFGIDIAAE